MHWVACLRKFGLLLISSRIFSARLLFQKISLEFVSFYSALIMTILNHFWFVFFVRFFFTNSNFDLFLAVLLMFEFCFNNGFHSFRNWYGLICYWHWLDFFISFVWQNFSQQILSKMRVLKLTEACALYFNFIIRMFCFVYFWYILETREPSIWVWILTQLMVKR